ncbi:hypothetical protein EDB83DRAFT_2514690 [Lactarius deliciosus]|nr:hypothetical protein EDB83DRAFT_2514690 [Lactarius deliciosus]
MPGFRVPPKPKLSPIRELIIQELRDLYDPRSSPRPPSIALFWRPPHRRTSPRIMAGQTQIEAQLLELAGMRDVQGNTFRGEKVAQGSSFEEAAQVVQRAHAADLERKQRLLEKRQKHGLLNVKDRTYPQNCGFDGRCTTSKNYKLFESDVEVDDSDDTGNEDPFTWFDDDQDDGRKDRDIIEPDVEGLSDVIRVDTSKIYYYTCYES